MSGPGPSDENFNPFNNVFGDIARLLGQQASGPLNWDVARQVAALIAAEGQAEPNVDPVDRIRIEEVARIAQLHVESQTGTAINVTSIESRTHTEWAMQSLDDYHDLLEKLAASIRSASSVAEVAELDEAQQQGMQQLESFLVPVLLGMQVGGMVGHMSRRSFAQFELPVPRRSTDKALFLPTNINQFAADWSLPADELSLYVALEEMARLSVLQRPHVRATLEALIASYIGGFRPDFSGMQDALSGLEIADPSQLPSAMTDPEVIFGAAHTPEQQRLVLQINAFVATFVGYVDHLVATIAPKVSSVTPAIAEATKRRRVEESKDARLVERLFGIELTQTQFDRGHAFINGVLERTGSTNDLEKLWHTADGVPTPSEIDAPGLWLARIDLPKES